MIKDNYIKLVFGLKIKQLRTGRKMSLSELGRRCGISVSYLNEIETGKKYPKPDKIAALSKALDTEYDKLVSLKLAKNLAPIGEFLESNILEQLPLDHYGIDINKLILLMADSPIQLSALIATLIEVARDSEMSRNNFSRTALRIFKEFNENYFEDLEKDTEKFLNKYSLNSPTKISSDRLIRILEKSFGYGTDESILNKKPELSGLRAVVLKNSGPVLLLNNKLSDAQKAFIAGKELAYNFLNIRDRSFIHSGMRLKTFDHLLNNFKASYFSTAVLVGRDRIIRDLEKLFKSRKWDGTVFLNIMNKYNCTAEMFLQRITNLLSNYFGLNKFFFFRVNREMGSSDYTISNELRLNTSRNPGAAAGNENFCRRWIFFKILNILETTIKKQKNFSGRTVSIYRSKFYDSPDEYICISVGQRGNLFENMISSITIGFQADDELRGKILFTEDAAIPSITVNEACERCRIPDCKERAAPPVSVERTEKYAAVEKALSELAADSRRII